jgi:hypothetical protein
LLHFANRSERAHAKAQSRKEIARVFLGDRLLRSFYAPWRELFVPYCSRKAKNNFNFDLTGAETQPSFHLEHSRLASSLPRPASREVAYLHSPQEFV